MAKRDGMYSSNKRKKEIQRQKKQEEKILRRQKGTKDVSPDSDEVELAGSEAVLSENTTEKQETDQ